MAITTEQWIVWPIIHALLLFHVAVTFFIFYMAQIKKNKMYRSTYYLLYPLLSPSDSATIINNFLNSKIIRIDAWKLWFFDHPTWDTVGWLLSGYLIYFQSIMHVAIAVNRAWMAFDLQKNKSHSIEKWGKVSILLIPFVALAILAYRFSGHSVYYYDEGGNLFSVYAETYIALVSFCYIFIAIKNNDVELIIKKRKNSCL